jgi:hypothetical protein
MIWGFHGISIMGVSKMVGFIMENPVKMDDERGYPYFRNPPFLLVTSYPLVNVYITMENHHAMKMDKSI